MGVLSLRKKTDFGGCSVESYVVRAINIRFYVECCFTTILPVVRKESSVATTITAGRRLMYFYGGGPRRQRFVQAEPGKIIVTVRRASDGRYNWSTVRGILLPSPVFYQFFLLSSGDGVKSSPFVLRKEISSFCQYPFRHHAGYGEGVSTIIPRSVKMVTTYRVPSIQS